MAGAVEMRGIEIPLAVLDVDPDSSGTAGIWSGYNLSSADGAGWAEGALGVSTSGVRIISSDVVIVGVTTDSGMSD